MSELQGKNLPFEGEHLSHFVNTKTKVLWIALDARRDRTVSDSPRSHVSAFKEVYDNRSKEELLR